MNNYEFLDLFLDGNNVYVYFASLLLSSTIYILIFRGYVRSIFDPLFTSVVFSSLGAAIMLFLMFTRTVSNSLLINYLLTQAAFFWGLFRFRSVEDTIAPRPVPQNFSQINQCFYFFTFITIACHLFTYKVRGIPLFMDSRLEAFIGGTGLGIFSRIMDVSILCSVLCYFFLTANSAHIKVTLLHHLLFLVLIVFLVLTGSKSAFLILPFALFCLTRFYPTLRNSLSQKFPFSILQNKFLLLGIGIGIALIILSVQKKQTPLTPLEELGYRLMLSGDVYYMSYPNHVYELIDGRNGLVALFQDFLGFFRIYPWEKMPEVLGVTLIKYHHGGELLWGPNGRHNIFGLIYFGYYGAIIMSLCLGLLVGLIRNKLLAVKHNNVFFFLLYSLLYIKVVTMETDPMLGFSYLTNVVFVFPFLFFLFLVYSEIRNSKDALTVAKNSE